MRVRLPLWAALAALALLAACGPAIQHETVSLYQPRHQTLAHQVLDLERDLGTEPGDYKLVDDILDEAVQEIQGHSLSSKEDAVFVLEIIHHVLGSSFSYRRNQLLNQGLKQNKLDCDLLTILYLSVAQKMNLPLKAVVVPRHSFIRWELGPGDYLNWETTSGSLVSDSHFLRGLHLDTQENYYFAPNFSMRVGVSKGAFMRSLEPQEFMALPHLNLASEYLRRMGAQKNGPAQRLNYLQKATSHYHQAAKLDPRRPEAYFGLALAQKIAGRLGAAIASLNRAIELNPEDPNYYFQRGNIRMMQGNLDNAIADLEKTYRLHPRHRKVCFTLAIAWSKKGNQKKREIWWTRAIKSGQKP
ncbi:MAG: tetratricopeptide repeat protein [Desulfarculaceae bacterium]